MSRRRTQFVRYLLRKIGYDLQKIQKTVVLHEQAATGFGRGGGFDAFEAVVPRTVEYFDIYLRSCARVDVFGQDRSRFVGVPKCELILRCLNSLLRSVEHARREGVEAEITLTVMDDHSDPDCVGRMKALLEQASFPANLQPLSDTGNGPSMKATFTDAKNQGRDLIYFVEDDYLHAETAVVEFVRSYERLAAVLKRDVVLFPSDYPEFYKAAFPSHILLGSHRHWRSIKSTTGTFIISRPLLDEHWDKIIAFSDYGLVEGVTEHNTINRMYQEVPCLCPMSSLAVHMQHFETLSPYVDWQEWWNRSAVETG